MAREKDIKEPVKKDEKLAPVHGGRTPGIDEEETQLGEPVK